MPKKKADKKTQRATGFTVRWSESERRDIQTAANGCVLRPTDIIRIGTMRLCAEYREKGEITLKATPAES